jgi:hypothetical protein
MRPLAAVLCMVALCVCACSLVKPELTQRYNHATWNKTQMTEECVAVSVFALDTPSAAESQGAQGGVAVPSLTPQGQAAFIRAVAGKSQNVKEFKDALGSTGSKGPDSGGKTDSTVFKKRLVFTVDKSLGCPVITPADRISDLRVSLKDISNASFASWDKFSTQYDTVDLGKITLTRQAGAELGGSLSMPGSDASAAINPKVTYSRGVNEEVSLRQRYVATTGRLTANDIVLYLQGVVGIDLTGNFLVDVMIRAKANPETQSVMEYDALRKEGKAVEPKALQIQFVDLKYPAASEPVTCRLEYAYWLRHVVKNDKTITEGDDDVDFIAGGGKGPLDVELIGKDELTTTVFGLVASELDGKTSSGGWHLSVKGVDETPVYFISYQSARDFLEWMNETGATGVPGYSFVINNRPIRPDEISRLWIKRQDLNKRKTKE